MDDRTKRRIAKVMALAEKGVGGEKDNAQRILDRAMAVHGFSMADIIRCDQVREKKAYSPATVMEKRLLAQIAVCVANRYDVRFYSRKGTKKTWLELEPLEHVEVEAMFDYYKKLMKQELDIFTEAFVNKHDLFSKDSKKQVQSSDEEVDLEKGLKLISIMNGMDSGNFVSTKKRLKGVN